MDRLGTGTGSGRRRTRLRLLQTLAGILGLVAGLATAAAAQTLSLSETEDLVRSVYFEGLPEEQALRVGPAGAQRLIEMLQDPEESPAHANILMTLGICGQPGAYAAIDEWASRSREGEIDRDTFRAWQMLPYALGQVARHDRRALVRLEATLDEEAPTWTFRHHRGARLHHQARRAAATALALSGLPEAGEILDRLSQRTSDADFDAHLRAARALQRSRAAGGPTR
jgi:HEAT repeat protein